MANTTIIPAVATVRLTTGLVLTGIAAATLTLTGYAVGYGYGITVPQSSVQGVLALSSDSPTLGLNLPSGGPGALALSGVAPTIVNGTSASPIQAALSLSGSSPALTLGQYYPPAGALSFAGAAPTVTVNGVTLAPGPATLLLSGAVPSVAGGSGSTTGVISLTSAPPQLAFAITPGSAQTAALGLLGATPVMDLNVTPGAGNVVMTTQISPTVAPSAAAISFVGFAPALSGVRALVPGTGSLAFASDVPQQLLQIPPPPCAALVLGGQFASTLVNSLIGPSAGSLALTGVPPSVPVSGFVVVPPAASLTLSGQPLAPLSWNNVSIAGALVLTGSTPAVSSSSTIVPPAGSVAFSGTQPTTYGGVGSGPVAGSVLLGGTTPVLSIGDVVATGVISLSGQSPSLLLSIAVPAASVAIVGAAPTINGNAVIPPLTGTIALIGGPASTQRAAVPSSVALSLAGLAPTLGLGVSPTAGQVSINGQPAIIQNTSLVFTNAGSLTISGAGIVLSSGIPVPPAVLAIVGAQPRVDSLQTVNVPVGALSLAGGQVSLANTAVPVPSAGAISLDGSAPILGRSGFVAPGVGAIAVAGSTPLVQFTTAGQVTPGTGTLTLLGAPAILPMYDPDPYYVVTSDAPSQYVVFAPSRSG